MMIFLLYIENNRYHIVCDIGNCGSDPVCPGFLRGGCQY